MGKPKITNRQWTSEEETVLTQLWEAGVPIKEIAEVLEYRTVDSINNHVGRMKLNRPTPTINKELLAKYSKIYQV